MRIAFVEKDRGPRNLLCEAEIYFDADGPLQGMKLSGIAIWRGEQGIFATFPSRQYKQGGKTRHWDYLRSADSGELAKQAIYRVKDWILDEYRERESVPPEEIGDWTTFRSRAMSEGRPEGWTFRAQIDKDGKIHPEEARTVRARLSRWAGRKVYFHVTLERKHRSLSANAYMWGVVYRAISDWSGFEVDEVHEVMKAMFLPPSKRALPTGEEVTVPGSTAGLDSNDFSEYVSRVKRWAAGQGCWIPEPGESEDMAL